MVLKIFRGVWFLSMLAVVANLLYVYAGLPPQVVVLEDVTGQTTVGVEFFFYLALAAILLVNVLVYIFAKVFAAEKDFRAWFHGQVITINLFFIIAMSMLQVYNSAEHFDFSRIGFVIYSSLGLMMVWALSWPMYSLIRRIFPKQVIS